MLVLCSSAHGGIACKHLSVQQRQQPIKCMCYCAWECTNFDWYGCRKTDDVEYQNYSKAVLQQLKTKLKRKRTRDSTLYYEMQDAPDMNKELIMHGLTSSMTLSIWQTLGRHHIVSKHFLCLQLLQQLIFSAPTVSYMPPCDLASFYTQLQRWCSCTYSCWSSTAEPVMPVWSTGSASCLTQQIVTMIVIVSKTGALHAWLCVCVKRERERERD